MDTTATWYRSGAVQSGGYVGCVGYDGGPVVGRFAFTTPQNGAARFSFRTSMLNAAGSTTWSSGDPGRFRFALTTDAQAKISACGGDGTAVGVHWGEDAHLDSDGERSQTLLPATTYYLWIYPAAEVYNLWRITGLTVTLYGSYGTAAAPAAADGVFGQSLSITLSGGSSGASYTVSAACAGRTETLQDRGSAVLLSWTPAVAVYAPLLPDAASAAATVTVETFYGNISAGTRSISLTLRFRAEDVGPVTAAGWFSHAPYNADRGAGIARYIQGVSRAAVSFDGGRVTARYGATVAGYRLSCRGSTVSQSPFRSPVLSEASELTLSVVDSRGFTASESLTVTPLPYAPPALQGVEVFRCDANGAAAGDGRFASVTAAAVFSALEGDNSAVIRCSLRRPGGSFGSAAVLASGQTALVSGLDADLNYELKLEITDSVGSSTSLLRLIPGQRWAMKFRPDGSGVGFGMAPQADKRLQIPADWEILRGAEAYIPLTEEGSSGIWRWKKWADGSFELTGGTSVTLDVDAGWGALYYGTLLVNEAFPFVPASIDFAAAWIADIFCWAIGNLGASLTDTGSIFALSAVQRMNTTLPLRLLLRGRWK